MTPAKLVHELELRGRTWHVVALYVSSVPGFEPFYFFPCRSPASYRAGLGYYGPLGKSPWRYVSRSGARKAAGRMLKAFPGWPFAYFTTHATHHHNPVRA